MDTTRTPETCINCQRSEAEIPILAFQFRGQRGGICSNCLPLLIHKPQKLAGRLPGAESIGPSPHTHD